MTQKKLLNILETGECLNVEFKRKFSTSEKIAKEMLAFANTKGGYLIFGIDDNGSVYGVESEKSETELIKDCANNFCSPSIDYNINYIEIKKKEVVVCEIFESSIKPHKIQDYKEGIDLNSSQVFIRVADKSVTASKEMIKLMQSQSNDQKLINYEVGKNEKLVFEYLDKNESITVKQFSKLVNISARRASRTLINLVRANLLFIHNRENGEDFFTYKG